MSLLALLLCPSALGAETAWVEVPFTAPEALPLYVQAEVVTVKGTVKADDCVGAVEAALSEAGAAGTVVRVLAAPDDVQAASQAVCKQRRAGDDITASLVTLHALVAKPGPTEAYPTVSAERTLQIVALTKVMSADGQIAPVDALDGKVWARIDAGALPEPLDSIRYAPRERATRAFDTLVRPWLVQWVHVVQGLSELQGVALEVQVAHRDPTKGRRATREERFRFAIPARVAAAFERGELMSEDLLAAIRVDRADNPKKRDFEPLDITGTGSAAVDPDTPPRPALPSVDEDLPEDEAPPSR